MVQETEALERNVNAENTGIYPYRGLHCKHMRLSWRGVPADSSKSAERTSKALTREAERADLFKSERRSAGGI